MNQHKSCIKTWPNFEFQDTLLEVHLKVRISSTFNNADVCKVKGELVLCFEFDKPCKAMQSSTKYADLTNACLHKVHS